MEEVDILKNTFPTYQNQSDSDDAISEISEVIHFITANLTKATNTNNTSILPSDLENTFNIVDSILRFVCNKYCTHTCIIIHIHIQIYV